MEETRQIVKELLSREVSKIKGTMVNRAIFEKFSTATVEAFEQEKKRMSKLEKLI